MPSRCQLCQRDVSELTRHHLIPQTRHRNKRNKKQFEREDVRTRTIEVCRPCHKNVHAVLTNKELERRSQSRRHLAQRRRHHPPCRRPHDRDQ